MPHRRQISQRPNDIARHEDDNTSHNRRRPWVRGAVAADVRTSSVRPSGASSCRRPDCDPDDGRSADRWEAKENAEFLRQLGFYHGLMRLNSGNAVLKGTTFTDGTIEFDVNTIGRGSPGIAFRQRDDDNFELLYLRPDPACPAFRACMQYAPQTHGVLLWDLFPQYQTRAPLRENGWNHIKMVVS